MFMHTRRRASPNLNPCQSSTLDSSTPSLPYLMLLCCLIECFKTNVRHLWISVHVPKTHVSHVWPRDGSWMPSTSEQAINQMLQFLRVCLQLVCSNEYINKILMPQSVGLELTSPSIWTRVPTCPPHSSKFCISWRNCRIPQSGFGSSHLVLFNIFLYSVFY